jgi:hypothetical protein
VDIPCGGVVEYLHRSPASRRRRRKGKSRIWDSKIWSRVPRDSDPRMTALTRTSSNCKRPVLSSERAPHINKLATSWLITIWLYAPDGCFIPRQTGRLTVSRNIRLGLSLVSCVTFVSRQERQLGTLLGSVTRKRLVKTEDFIYAAVIVIFRVCKSVRLL